MRDQRPLTRRRTIKVSESLGTWVDGYGARRLAATSSCPTFETKDTLPNVPLDVSEERILSQIPMHDREKFVLCASCEWTGSKYHLCMVYNAWSNLGKSRLGTGRMGRFSNTTVQHQSTTYNISINRCFFFPKYLRSARELNAKPSLFVYFLLVIRFLVSWRNKMSSSNGLSLKILLSRL
jgi:hypothetical protein